MWRIPVRMSIDRKESIERRSARPHSPEISATRCRVKPVT
jgi:hypothetical protein